jgi:hypothetical protein
MKKKIIGIVISLLLLGTTNIAIADWAPGDGHKMHYPQLPDPNGFDIAFSDWWLGDDWQCSETGTVNDIHFWTSWFWDDPIPISEIFIQIWSNNPVGPYGWSEPLDLLWERSFVPGQFIEAGPWPGDQLWMMPWGEVIPQPHFFYWQINIPNIDDPFVQIEGEIYWLVIKIPFPDPMILGWKNTKDYFMDHAVWHDGVMWIMIDGIDFAFVITGEPLPPPVPWIDCDGDLTWTAVKPGATVTGSFNVSNIGDLTSELDWDITDWPAWGTWTFNPNGGTDLTPEDGPVTVQVTVVAPKGEATATAYPQDKTYTGQVKLVNLDDTTDFCTIDVSLTTPKNNPFTFNYTLLRWLIERFPNAFPIIRYVLEL